MIFTDVGKCAVTNLQNITAHYPYAEMPLFVVMPNHIHAIVVINAHCRDVSRYVSSSNHPSNNSTNEQVSHDNILHGDVSRYVSTNNHFSNNSTNEQIGHDNILHGDVSRYVSTKMQNIALHQSLLSWVIRGFKTAVTHYAGEHNIEFAWQTRFHDHIVRSQDELNMIGNYIQNNVAKWEMDCFH
nr:hypothetical protein [Prevotella sp.]